MTWPFANDDSAPGAVSPQLAVPKRIPAFAFACRNLPDSVLVPTKCLSFREWLPFRFQHHANARSLSCGATRTYKLGKEMRLGLEHLDARGVAVDLAEAMGGDAGSPAQRLTIRSATALRGSLLQEADRFEVEDVEAEYLVLEALALAFGSVSIGLTREATLGQLRASYARRGGESRFELSSHGLHAAVLRIEAGSVLVSGEARLQNTRLTLAGGEGRIEAELARVEDFRLQIGGLLLTAPELAAEGLVVGWGGSGFRLEARQLSGPALSLRVGSVKLDAEAALLRELSVRGPNVSVAEARVERGSFEMSFASDAAAEPVPPPAPPALRSRPHRPSFDYALLDGLSGALHVDAVVDMTVPIFGNRRATHKLRLSVDDGSIDYRELEAGLSALEESLLDFSVREDALVLERGIPLLPTRGFGKPLLIWDLGAEDLALAQRRRIRLSVLPRARLARELSEARDDRESSSSWTFALRRLGLENIALDLAHRDLGWAVPAALERLSVSRLKAYGEIQHELSGPARPGVVRAELEGLAASVHELALGASLTLTVPDLALGKLSDASLSFVGLKPTHLRVAIEALALRDAKLTSDES
jgi:hypothetical protein